MDKKSENEEAAVDYRRGDVENGISGWINCIKELGEQEREKRKTQIKNWAESAGPPHATITLGDDPEYLEKIGFWRIDSGIVRICANKTGEFDPAERTEITDKEIKAIMNAFGHCSISQ